MHRTRLAMSVLGALALAGCSADKPEPLSPLAPGAASRSVSATSGRYILASNGKFSKDLAAQVAALGGTLESVHAGAGIAVVSGISDAAATKLSAISGVNEVQPNAEFSLDNPVATIDADASDVAADATISSVANPAGASRYSWQWNMRDINASAAWSAGKLGDPGVTVAILDTGIDYDDPDLNGLVDLSRSKSFIALDDAITATYFPTRNKINDYNGHGTNVAAQVSSKAAVHAGVTSKTTLIGVKVLDATGHGSLDAVLNGVLWAADHGADVANMSLGGGFAKAGNGRYVSLINRVFNYANRQGMLVVVAAGNEEEDLDHNGNMLKTYCDQPHVVCVSAVGPTTPTGNPDEFSFYSNYGRSAISVAGPGGNGGDVVSMWPYGSGNWSYVWSYCAKQRLVLDANNNVLGYAGCQAGNRVSGFAGTSQATPHVAGLAALLVAEKGHGNPAAIKAAIQKSADDLGQPGTDPFYGRGRINVAKALGL